MADQRTDFEHAAEAETIRRAQGGDSGAFSGLFRTHYGRVYRTVHGMMGNEDDAREVSQQVWLKAWQKLDRYNFGSAFTTWLHRIAVNTALDELRRRKRRWSRFKSLLAPGDTEAAQAKAPDPPAPSDPAHELLRKERSRIVREAIARLPEAQRTVLVLKEFEDYTYEQIADTLGCRIGTVMSRLHLARKKLQKLLNPPPS